MCYLDCISGVRRESLGKRANKKINFQKRLMKICIMLRDAAVDSKTLFRYSASGVGIHMNSYSILGSINQSIYLSINPSINLSIYLYVALLAASIHISSSTLRSTAISFATCIPQVLR